MFRSLRMKLVVVLVLLEISVMAVVGTFLISSVTAYNIENFKSQMAMAFSQEFILSLDRTAAESGAEGLRDVMEAYSGALGLGEYRVFFLLDAKGNYLYGTGQSEPELTPNMLRALEGEVGQSIGRLSPYFDVAVPVSADGVTTAFVVGVLDSRQELDDLTFTLFTILVRAMLFGLLVAVLLSFFLSKTITDPVEKLTAQATAIAGGDFARLPESQSGDEIGELTETFNEMAGVLEHTLLEIQEEKNKLSTLFQHMADGVAAFDSTGRIILINPEAENMLRREGVDMVHYSDLFPNLSFEDREAQAQGDDPFVEVDYSANKRILKIFFVPLELGGGRGLMAVMHDITQQKRLEESQREFVANVSHELRTPLTNIKGYTETILDAGDEIDRETRDSFLGIVHSEADRMTTIVKDLLTLSQLDYGRMEMNLSPADLGRLAADSARAMKLEAQRQQITLRCLAPEHLPPVMGDQARLEQVIVNIISNAIKYNRPQGTVTVTGGAENGRVFLQVQDTGFGVSPEALPRVFDRFYRVDKARSRAKGGTGLGLPIAKQIVETLGGTITFESEENKGSTVTLSFPEYREEAHA